MPSTERNMSVNNNSVLTNEQKLDSLKQAVKDYPDFPKKGILFRDFFPIFRHPSLVNNMIDLFVDRIKESSSLSSPSGSDEIDVVIGLESRGFLIGPLVALRLNKPFVPIRKKGKLPGHVKQLSYDLEYSSDTFEIQMDSLSAGNKILLIDDLLATGGTLKCALQLIQSFNCHVTHALVFIELSHLKGRQLLHGVNIHSLIKY